MSQAELSLIWKGKFWYDPEEFETDNEVCFELYVHYLDNHFEGVVYDEEFRLYSEKLPTVKGWIEKDAMHFTVNYPIGFSINEADEIEIDPSHAGHDVFYHGTFDVHDNMWRGTWEIIEKEEQQGDQIIYQNYSSGDWELFIDQK